jgi:hypothetical protein
MTPKKPTNHPFQLFGFGSWVKHLTFLLSTSNYNKKFVSGSPTIRHWVKAALQPNVCHRYFRSLSVLTQKRKQQRKRWKLKMEMEVRMNDELMPEL